MTEAETFLKERGFDPSRMSGRGWDIGAPLKGDINDPAYRKKYMEYVVKKYDTREGYIGKYGFAILSTLAIEAIRPHAPLVEVGCGSGYWSYELKKAGIDIIATEPHPEVRGKYRNAQWKMWTEYERLTGCEAVKKYPNRTLLSVWPDYAKRWTSLTLEAFTGDVVIYVGEGQGGCTADDKFHELLDDKFTLITELAIPQFDGIHDSLNIYRRKA